ncbi:uncharacterized protein L201_005958 [Kwoniella dendrophila CBS 6074]|uniref:WSC domain-containing protein n=1 Tax=Kwoniella dendrophila CBS 6074 TaxID=1295534 RepID=A0AAX4K2P9_9TREE
MFFYTSLIILSSFVCKQVSAYTFIGCTDTFNFKPQPNDTAVHYAGGTSSGCASYCATFDKAYFYNQYNTGKCYCSNASPKPSQYTYSSSELGGCEGDNYEIYAMKDPIKSAKLEGCFASITTTTQYSSNNVKSVESCFSSCPTSKSILFFPNSDTNSFDCKCDSNSIIDTSNGGMATCGQYTWFAYSRTSQSPNKRSNEKRRFPKQIAFNKDEEEENCEEESAK